MTNRLSDFELRDEIAVELLTLLNQESACLQAMRDHLLEKAQILVGGKPDLLAQLDEQLLKCVKHSETLQHQRQQLLSTLPNFPETLKALLPLVPARLRKEFSLLRVHMLGLSEQISQLNAENKALIELSLMWVKDTISVIADAIEPKTASYTAQGGTASSGSQSTVVHSA